MTVVFSDFPGQMGEPKDIFDAARDGPRRYTNIPTNALLEVTPKCFEQVGKGEERQVFTAWNRIRVQVTEISKIDASSWHLVLFDGWTYFNASMSTKLDMVSMGMTGLLKNNASDVMTEGEEMLKVGDVISIPQYLIMGDEGEGTKCMCLYNLSIYHHA